MINQPDPKLIQTLTELGAAVLLQHLEAQTRAVSQLTAAHRLNGAITRRLDKMIPDASTPGRRITIPAPKKAKHWTQTPKGREQMRQNAKKAHAVQAAAEPRKRAPMSASARKAIGKAQRARWRKLRKEQREA